MSAPLALRKRARCPRCSGTAADTDGVLWHVENCLDGMSLHEALHVLLGTPCSNLSHEEAAK